MERVGLEGYHALPTIPVEPQGTTSVAVCGKPVDSLASIGYLIQIVPPIFASGKISVLPAFWVAILLVSD